ncbi:MAG: hypothetical protein JWO30_314 [Fibrobacteres bacterium]|nr:hypothetical protein [Fibrobacterota bacterium]
MALDTIRRILPTLVGIVFFASLAAAPGAHAGAAVNIATAARAKAVRCDYYIITDSVFTVQAEHLADFRHIVTLPVANYPCIAKMEDIYKNYPPKGPKWTSLQAFLKAAYTQSAGALSHVVLLGDASFDENSPDNHVPTFSQRILSLQRFSPDTVFYDTMSSDDAYAAFFDSVGYDSVPKLAFAIGRIPARTPAQADAYIDKVENYEAHFPYGPGAFTYGFLSDDDLQKGSPEDQDPILSMPELHQEIWDALPVKPFVRRMLSIEYPIQADGTKPAAKNATLDLFNAGPGRVYFIGHGSPHQLTDENIFEVPGDLTRLEPKRLQPIVSMLACTTARFADPNSESMGEQLLFHPNGAVAFLGGTIPTYPNPNNVLFKRWNAFALNGGTLGRAFASAKDSAYDYRNNAAYAILGDPALTLHVPTFDLAPASGSGASRLVLPGNLGDSAYFQLVRIDSLPFNAVISASNQQQRDKSYIRERVLAEGLGVVGAGGSVTFTLPTAGDPRDVAIKFMTWTTYGMHYGHLPLESLGLVALNPVRKSVPGREGFRLVLRGGGLVFEGQGRRVGLDGRDIR